MVEHAVCLRTVNWVMSVLISSFLNSYPLFGVVSCNFFYSFLEKKRRSCFRLIITFKSNISRLFSIQTWCIISQVMSCLITFISCKLTICMMKLREWQCTTFCTFYSTYPNLVLLIIFNLKKLGYIYLETKNRGNLHINFENYALWAFIQWVSHT